ncbi:P-loop containing nucleoside triphosphate hydrolase protein [Annulohypoxylon maeteangense]|uniref:P-loop containing nucleoside triphosphate hydrolase protein n=1 Tax=Annulohypoxylon maeteangense TaxID=1927788 RepID=UPI002008B2A1|nr:P-loop containing nucleoside triphosphate hydrolase protein [Annulohypoxylon maeteangense]KAI0886208.1 P-loop containing nucleoside triphosphate hydrolase protein [Annulohypoxylon maeteangense]
MAYASKYKSKPITDIFTADTDIDRRQCTRTVPMKVLLLGCGRTGTTSMRAAMKQLGYVDTYHMMSCSIENPPDALLWMDALRAKYDGIGTPFTRKDWDKLLGNAQAVCDWPACAFAKELIEAYPEAKVVLTGRDVDSWHASTMRTVYWRATDPELRLLSRCSWAAGMYYPMLKKFFDTFFEGDFPGRGKEVFTRHYEEVKKMVPEGKLLEFRVQDGWEPLCRFLGEPVPTEVGFPNVNDNKDFVTRSRRRNRMQMMNVAARGVEVVVLLGVVLYLIFCVQWRLF